jgi:membrane protein DedA with SNARE-associated domain
VRALRFLFYDGLGALLYTGTYVGLGYLFSYQLEGMMIYTVRLGSVILAGLVAATAAYIAFKFLQRHRGQDHPGGAPGTAGCRPGGLRPGPAE